MLNIGMLWFDSSPSPLAEKIGKAAAYYKTKYGSDANLVHVHPSTDGAPAKVGEIQVVTNKHVRPNHLWVGMKE
jgi:hypothetical protein